VPLEGAASVVFLFGGDDGSAFVCRLRMRANGRMLPAPAVDRDSAWAVRNPLGIACILEWGMVEEVFFLNVCMPATSDAPTKREANKCNGW